MAWASWGEVFNHYVAKGGEDHASAACRADVWQERDRRNRGLCTNCGQPAPAKPEPEGE